jgi:hypothetical protein
MLPSLLGPFEQARVIGCVPWFQPKDRNLTTTLVSVPTCEVMVADPQECVCVWRTGYCRSSGARVVCDHVYYSIYPGRSLYCALPTEAVRPSPTLPSSSSYSSPIHTAETPYPVFLQSPYDLATILGTSYFTATRSTTAMASTTSQTSMTTVKACTSTNNNNNNNHQTANTFPLLRLPRELRQEIFSYLLEFGAVIPTPSWKRDTQKPFQVWWFDADGRRVLQHSAPLYTCRLLYRECLPVLRRVRLMINDCELVTPLVNSMDEKTRAMVRSVTLSKPSVEKKGAWAEVCQGLKKLDLKDLQISIDGTEKVLQAMRSEGDELVDESSSSEEEDTPSGGACPETNNVPTRKMDWVENMLGIRGLRRLSVSIPKASLLENEVRSYLKTRTSIQVV